MKKIILLFAISTIAILSCSKKRQTELSSKNVTSEITTENVGLIHNQSLKYVYDKLSSDLVNNSNIKISKEELALKVRIYSAEYLVSQNIEKDLNSILSRYNLIGYNENYAKSLCKISFTDRKIEQDIVINRLSSPVAKFTFEMNSIIDSSETINNLTTKLDFLISNSSRNLTETESCQIIAISNIAKASFIYWIENENLNKWKIIFSKTNLKTSVYSGGPNGMAKEAIKADCEGFVGGAMGGCIAGPMGWLAGGCIGAPVSSAWALMWL